MAESTVRIEFAGSTGEVVALKAHPVEGGFEIDEYSMDLPGVNVGDFVTADNRSGRLLFNGEHTPGPRRSGFFLGPEDIMGEVAELLKPMCETVEEHEGHYHFVCLEVSATAVEDFLDEKVEDTELQYSWDFPPDEGGDILRVDSLSTLGRIFAAITREELPNAKSPCGHLHPWHVLGALESPGAEPEDEETPAFPDLPAAFSSRLPVDIGSAVLVDDRAVEALGDLAAPYVTVIDLRVHLSRDEDDHRPEGMWVEAVLGVYVDEGVLETIAFIDAPFDLHGSRLHLEASAGLGMTMWATNLKGHDKNVLCYYLAPIDPEEVSSPLAKALLETHDKLRSALRDYALVSLAEERDSLLEVVNHHLHHEIYDEEDADFEELEELMNGSDKETESESSDAATMKNFKDLLDSVDAATVEDKSLDTNEDVASEESTSKVEPDLESSPQSIEVEPEESTSAEESEGMPDSEPTKD